LGVRQQTGLQISAQLCGRLRVERRRLPVNVLHIQRRQPAAYEAGARLRRLSLDIALSKRHE